MSSVIVEELVAVLEYQIKNGKNSKKFGDEMDRLERKAKKHGTTLARETKKASRAIEREEKRKRAALRKTRKEMSSVNKFINKNADALAALGGAYLGFKGVQFGKDSFNQFAALERQLTRIGITAGSTREETNAALSQIQDLTIDLGFPDVGPAREALDTLTASGLNLEDSLSFLPSVLATAQASGAATSDIANTAQKASSALKIEAGEMQEAFDIMVAGGKAGQFELKDMAQFIPSLASQFEVLGGTGLDGLRELIALLQTLRKKTGTSSAAATQLSNIFGKINSPETTKKFAKFGVDLDEELAAAVKNGESMIEAFVRLTKVAIDGDNTKLAKIFTDQEFRLGMISLVNGEKDMQSFVDTLNDSELKGGVFRDLERVMGDTQAEIDRLSSNWDKFKTNLGAGIGTVATPLLEGINDKFDSDRFTDDVIAKEAKTEVDEAAEFNKRFEEFQPEEQGFFGGFDKREFTDKERAANTLFEDGGADALNASKFNSQVKGLIKRIQLEIGNMDALEIKVVGIFGESNFDNVIKNPESLKAYKKFKAEERKAEAPQAEKPIKDQIKTSIEKRPIDQADQPKALGLTPEEVASKIQVIAPAVVAEKAKTDSIVTSNNVNSRQQVTNNINVEQNVSQATDAPLKAANATAQALTQVSANRAQLQAEPSQP